MHPRVAIVVVTHDSERHADACFGALARAGVPGRADVLVVDNASKDRTVARVRAGFPWATVVESGANLGFAGGNNVGIQRALDAGAEFVYLLNPDTEVAPAFLDEALAVAEREPRAAAVQSLILLASDRERVNTAGNEIHFLGFGYCGRLGAPRASIDSEPRDVAFASGAGVLLRAAALREAGLFDDALFLYHEDLDLGWRLQLAGWRNVVAPRSVVWHEYAFSRNHGKWFYAERNRFLVLAKNLRVRSLVALAPFLLAGELGVLAVAAGSGWLPEKLRAYRALARRETWAHVRRQRAVVAAIRKVSDREVARTFTHALVLDGLPGGWLPRALEAPMWLVWRAVRPLLG